MSKNHLIVLILFLSIVVNIIIGLKYLEIPRGRACFKSQNRHVHLCNTTVHDENYTSVVVSILIHEMGERGGHAYSRGGAYFKVRPTGGALIRGMGALIRRFTVYETKLKFPERDTARGPSTHTIPKQINYKYTSVCIPARLCDIQVHFNLLARIDNVIPAH